jgi:hypothetical protein
LAHLSLGLDVHETIFQKQYLEIILDKLSQFKQAFDLKDTIKIK